MIQTLKHINGDSIASLGQNEIQVYHQFTIVPLSDVKIITEIKPVLHTYAHFGD